MLFLFFELMFVWIKVLYFGKFYSSQCFCTLQMTKTRKDKYPPSVSIFLILQDNNEAFYFQPKGLLTI